MGPLLQLTALVSRTPKFRTPKFCRLLLCQVQQKLPASHPHQQYIVLVVAVAVHEWWCWDVARTASEAAWNLTGVRSGALRRCVSWGMRPSSLIAIQRLFQLISMS